jgi:hypothetical protein
VVRGRRPGVRGYGLGVRGYENAVERILAAGFSLLAHRLESLRHLAIAAE